MCQELETKTHLIFKCPFYYVIKGHYYYLYQDWVSQVRKENIDHTSPLSKIIMRIEGLLPKFESIELFHILWSCNHQANEMAIKAVSLGKAALSKNEGDLVTNLIP